LRRRARASDCTLYVVSAFGLRAFFGAFAFGLSDVIASAFGVICSDIVFPLDRLSARERLAYAETRLD
jgi:hypothetical protein